MSLCLGVLDVAGLRFPIGLAINVTCRLWFGFVFGFVVGVFALFKFGLFSEGS